MLRVSESHWAQEFLLRWNSIELLLDTIVSSGILDVRLKSQIHHKHQAMLTEIFPFSFAIDATAIAGASLWSLALYWGLSPLTEWVILQLNRWMNFAERSLYTSEAEFERTREAREAQNAFYASLLSIVPFLIAGGLCNWGVEFSLGTGWAVSMGTIACIGGGVYELGRRDGQS
jgi:hypothetical protein